MSGPGGPGREEVRVLTVTVCFKSGGQLESHLRSLHSAAQGTTVRHIIVDNSCEAEAQAVVRRLRESEDWDVTYVAVPENPGYGAGANIGWRMAGSGEYVLVSNPDLELRPERALAALVWHLREAGQRAVIAFPRLEDSRGVDVRLRKGLPSPWSYPLWVCSGMWPSVRMGPRNLGHATNLSGAVFMLAPSAATGIGMFDESLFLFMEDTDLAQRASNLELEVVPVPDAVARHYGGGSTRSSAKTSVAQQAFIARAIYFHKHFGRSGLRLAMFWMVPEAFAEAVFRACRNADVRHLRGFGTILALSRRAWVTDPVHLQDAYVRPQFRSRRLSTLEP